MIYTIERRADGTEVDLIVELRYHEAFNGGRDEPSEPVWIEVTGIFTERGDDVMSELSDTTLRDIASQAQHERPDDL